MDTNAPKEYIVLKALQGNDPPELNAIQRFMEPHLGAFITGWYVVWCVTACVLLAVLFREYQKHRREH